MIGRFRSPFLFMQMRSEQWDADIEQALAERLEEQVAYAASEVQYYKDAIGDLRIRGLEDLPSLPLLTKEMVRDSPDSFISRRHRKEGLRGLSTSGSTGIPLKYYIDEDESGFRSAGLAYAYMEAGQRFFDRIAFVTYDPRKQAESYRSSVFRYSFLSMFDEEGRTLSSIRRLSPAQLRSYPSVLVQLAKRNLESACRVSVRNVFSGAETLSQDARKLISDSFGCEVRDFYGAIETGRIAWECGKGSLHLIPGYMIAEVLDHSGDPLPDGRMGDLVLTQLFQRAMPLIRYKIGDRAILSKGCACGRKGKIIKKLAGRVSAMLVMPSGKAWNSLALDIYIRTFPGILLFQAVQEGPGALLIRLVPRGRFDEGLIRAMRERIRSCFPEPMEIEIELVDRLPPGRKFQVVSTQVKPGA
ncbi:MAG: hypothetical protein U0R44_04960 [Candidatus Micrarchaeia archaeon]